MDTALQPPRNGTASMELESQSRQKEGDDIMRISKSLYYGAIVAFVLTLASSIAGWGAYFSSHSGADAIKQCSTGMSMCKYPYEAVTHNSGHILPEMYGKVKEKTIWLYWNTEGTLPPIIQLMIETFNRNKGDFDVRLVYKHEVGKYVSRIELPFGWEGLIPAQQKDSLMNALLARYGGVAMDASIVLFRSLDEWWDEMLKNRSVFRGYMYSHIETAVWFMMARRGGIFANAVIAQVIGMGDDQNTNKYGKKNNEMYFALGDGTITPILGMYDYSKKRCNMPRLDKLPSEKQTHERICYPPLQTDELVGPEIGRDLLMISSPGKVQFDWPHSFLLWNVSDHKSEWEEFMRRYKNPEFFRFAKMFSAGGKEAKQLSREQLLDRKDSFLCHFLCLAGSNQCNIKCDIQE